MHKTWNSIEEVPYCLSRSSIKLRGHTWSKSPNWEFMDCTFNLNWPMSTKWCTNLELAHKGCLIFFQGHPSNFKVPRDKILPFFTRIEHCHWWHSNNRQRLSEHRGRSPLVFESIHLIRADKYIKMNPISLRLLGRSQLSNPSGLPFFLK